jgi:AcrR family transcriptional regulator
MPRSPGPAPRARRPRRRLEATEARRRILDAAEKRLAEGGPEAIRLQELAGDLGISHPAILHHFGSREGLLGALEVRAIEQLRRDLLERRRGSVGEDLERVFATLSGEGHARLLAWRVLRAGRAPVREDAKLLRELADAFHAERVEEARHGGRSAPSHEDTVFGVRLATVAMFGEALLGPLLTASAGLGDDARASRRFRRWLGALLDERSPSASSTPTTTTTRPRTPSSATWTGACASAACSGPRSTAASACWWAGG